MPSAVSNIRHILSNMFLLGSGERRRSLNPINDLKGIRAGFQNTTRTKERSTICLASLFLCAPRDELLGVK